MKASANICHRVSHHLGLDTDHSPEVGDHRLVAHAEAAAAANEREAGL